MKKIFLLILKQIHEDLYKDFRNEKQFKRPPITHRGFKSENIPFFFKILIILLFVIFLCQPKYNNINIV